MGDLDLDIGGAGAGLEGSAVIEGNFVIDFGTEDGSLGSAERRRGQALGEEAMANVADDDAVVIEDVPEGGADIDGAGRRQQIIGGEIFGHGRFDGDGEGAGGGLAAGVAGVASDGGGADGEGGTGRRIAGDVDGRATAGGTVGVEDDGSGRAGGGGGDIGGANDGERRAGAIGVQAHLSGGGDGRRPGSAAVEADFG